MRFRGYGSEHDMWIPSSAFRKPVEFQTISKRGRVRKHKTKDECEVEVQQRKRPKQSNVSESLLELPRERRNRPPKMTIKNSENPSRTFVRVVVTVEVTWQNRHHMFITNGRLKMKPISS